MTGINKDVARLLENMPPQMKTCFKLAELERQWEGIVGAELARRSALAVCDLEEDRAVITVHVADAATLASMNFLRARLARMLKDYLKFPAVSVSVKVGKIKRSAAQPPLPEWRRRAPVVADEETVEIAEAFTSSLIGDETLAKTFARLKVLVERRKGRGGRPS